MSQQGELSLLQVFDHHAAVRPEATALRFVRDGTVVVEELTYGELTGRALGVAAALAADGLRGERALLVYPPSTDFVVAFLGCLYAGVVAVPLDPPRPNRPGRRLPAVARDCAAAVALTSGRSKKLAEDLEAALPGARVLVTDGVPAMPAGGDGGGRPGADDLAMLQYTSGSTGQPKGVRLTHGNVIANERMIQRAFRHGPDSNAVSWLPLYHDMGLFGGLLQPLVMGAQVTLMSPLDFLQRPVRWLKAISAFRAHSSGGPNFGYELCAARVTEEQKAELDLTCWRRAFNGAERINAGTLERFAAAFAPCGFRSGAFLTCYGMAEATLFVSGIGDDRPPRVREAEGLELVGCGPVAEELRLEIVDPETSLPRPAGEIGEIWLAGPSISGGYWSGSAGAFDAWLRGPANGPEEGPFFRTGDLGVVLDGELFVAGRIKELIIVEGANHYPQDVEATVEACHEAVGRGGVAAFALEEDGREALGLAVEIEARRPPAPEVAEALFRAVLQAVSEEHGLRAAQIVLVPRGRLPRTTSNKIRRLACARELAAGDLECLASLRPLARSAERPAEPEALARQTR